MISRCQFGWQAPDRHRPHNLRPRPRAYRRDGAHEACAASPGGRGLPLRPGLRGNAYPQPQRLQHPVHHACEGRCTRQRRDQLDGPAGRSLGRLFAALRSGRSRHLHQPDRAGGRVPLADHAGERHRPCRGTGAACERAAQPLRRLSLGRWRRASWRHAAHRFQFVRALAQGLGRFRIRRPAGDARHAPAQSTTAKRSRRLCPLLRPCPPRSAPTARPRPMSTSTRPSRSRSP